MEPSMHAAKPWSKSRHMHGAKADTCIKAWSQCAGRQLQWRRVHSRQLLWWNDVSCLFPPSNTTSRQLRWRARCISANANGGYFFPPVRVADTYFRRCRWRKEPRVAFRRFRQARNGNIFRRGSFSTIRLGRGVYL
jgi:hypothetical protein